MSMWTEIIQTEVWDGLPEEGMVGLDLEDEKEVTRARGQRIHSRERNSMCEDLDRRKEDEKNA